MQFFGEKKCPVGIRSKGLQSATTTLPFSLYLLHSLPLSIYYTTPSPLDLKKITTTFILEINSSKLNSYFLDTVPQFWIQNYLKIIWIQINFFNFCHPLQYFRKLQHRVLSVLHLVGKLDGSLPFECALYNVHFFKIISSHVTFTNNVKLHEKDFIIIISPDDTLTIPVFLTFRKLI